MKTITYSNKISWFFRYEFLKTQYLRWGNTQIVKKQSDLFDIVWKDKMKLLPNANFIMHYNWMKWILPIESIKKSKEIDIKYVGKPTDEQKDILNIIKERSNKYLYHWWLIVMKTGRWKSHIICQILSFYKCKTIIATHNIKTLQEMSEKINTFSRGRFKVWLYYWKIKTMWDIIITTHTSLNKVNWRIKIKWEEFKPDILLFDEADRNISPKMIKTFCNMNIQWMYWLTWTPNSKDLQESDLNKIFWKTIKSKKWWYNIIPIIKYIRYRTNEDYEFTNYNELRECLFEDKDRYNTQLKYIKHTMKYRNFWLLMSDRISEVKRYYEDLKDLDMNVIIITWETKVSDDEEKISKSKWSKTLIIWTSWKMSRWVDIPEIDTVFLFYPNKFESATIQSVWRWLRNHESKQNTLLVDWCDYPILKNQMYQRWKTYRNEYKIEINKQNEAKSIL